MDAKKLLKKHLELNIPKGIFLSPKQIEQHTYDATIDAINEALAYVPEPIDTKLILIGKIKDSINKYGRFDMTYDEISGENTIVVFMDGHKSVEIDSFDLDEVNCVRYDEDVAVDDVTYSYSELTEDTLLEIAYLVDMVATAEEKTLKRIS